jgi:hypothetical protein
MYNVLVEPFAAWTFWIDLASAVCAFGAAAFWLKASLVKMPGGPIHLVHPHFEKAVLDVTRRQSRLNSLAAAFAAVAALLTGFSVLIGTRWD